MEKEESFWEAHSSVSYPFSHDNRGACPRSTEGISERLWLLLRTQLRMEDLAAGRAGSGALAREVGGQRVIEWPPLSLA